MGLCKPRVPLQGLIQGGRNKCLVILVNKTITSQANLKGGYYQKLLPLEINFLKNTGFSKYSQTVTNFISKEAETRQALQMHAEASRLLSPTRDALNLRNQRARSTRETLGYE